MRTAPTFCLVHKPRAVIIALPRHIDKTLYRLIGASFGCRDRGVILDDEAAWIVGLDGGAAVAQPEEVPVVAVGRPWLPIFGPGAQYILCSLREERKLALEGGIPVCVVFHDQGSGEAAIDHFPGKVQV